jgi:hypothetical protein
MAYVHEDRPATVRLHRRGRPVRSDPRCVLVLMGFDQLDPL